MSCRPSQVGTGQIFEKSRLPQTTNENLPQLSQPITKQNTSRTASHYSFVINMFTPLVRVSYLWYLYYTSGTCIIHLVPILYIWYLYHTSGTYIIHLVPVSYIWYVYHTSGTCIIHLVPILYLWYLYHTPGTCIIPVVPISSI